MRNNYTHSADLHRIRKSAQSGERQCDRYAIENKYEYQQSKKQYNIIYRNNNAKVTLKSKERTGTVQRLYLHLQCEFFQCVKILKYSVVYSFVHFQYI